MRMPPFHTHFAKFALAALVRISQRSKKSINLKFNNTIDRKSLTTNF
jgi:hypothetical protein